MKRAKDKITAMLNAITFAEAGEHETARQYLEESPAPAQVLENNQRSHDTARGSATRDLLQTLQEHLVASVFAQAGDFRTAEDMLHPAERPRTVLLVIEGKNPDEAAFHYALGVCKRTGAQMDILHLMGGSVEERELSDLARLREKLSATLGPLLRQLESEGVPFRVTLRFGDVREKLYRYATRHTDVVMAVYDPITSREESTGSRGRQRMVEKISRRLSIPLVIVSERHPIGQMS